MRSSATANPYNAQNHVEPWQKVRTEARRFPPPPSYRTQLLCSSEFALNQGLSVKRDLFLASSAATQTCGVKPLASHLVLADLLHLLLVTV